MLHYLPVSIIIHDDKNFRKYHVWSLALLSGNTNENFNINKYLGKYHGGVECQEMMKARSRPDVEQ